MRIQTKRTLQIALVSGGLLMVGAGVASASVTDAELPAASQQRPAPAAEAPAPAAVLHTVPLHLLQQEVTPSTEVTGDLPEHDLNAPLGSELAATELPIALPLTATADTESDRTTTPIDGGLPLHGTVTTQPLNPTAGTRVTGLSTSDSPRADAPAAGLPLLGALLPSANGLLPTQALGGASDLTSLAGLTKLAGSTPLNQGGRYNTGAVTAPVTQHGPGAIESATKLLGK
ncbi:hypothetical protein [Amycolatopsis kentuckyensis]|uniref:hypothetical protein n=1 Tax=Amycolatopsis kentuckyensis TaxID=218823 RepID=UPI003566ADC7